jgi:hypothetical protein
MGEAEGSHTKAHDLTRGTQKNRSCAESAMGEVQVEESCLDGKFRSSGHVVSMSLFATYNTQAQIDRGELEAGPVQSAELPK